MNYVWLVGGLWGVWLFRAWFARVQLRKIFLSGDVGQVLHVWHTSGQLVAYPETVGPLMAATAYAAYGWMDPAYAALGKAKPGPVWDAMVEQRLFVEVLLDTFSGERDAATRKAAALERLPITPWNLLMRRRIAALRRGLSALTRAFAHASTREDVRWLKQASASFPLLHWAMRYAQAIVAVDHGESAKVPSLLEGAPVWPKESAFALYHDELLACAPPVQ